MRACEGLLALDPVERKWELARDPMDVKMNASALRVYGCG